MATTSVNDAEFENEVLQADSPVLVDFWAEWCGPCKALSPLLDEVAGEMDGKIKVVKVNIEEAPEAPTKYGVRGVPTLMIFKNGQVVETRVGGMPKGQLSEWIESAV